MDALSNVLDDMQLSKAEFIYLNTRSIWAFRQQHPSALIIYIMLSGEMYIDLAAQSIQLSTGDIFLLTNGQHHQCYQHSNHQLVETIDITPYFQSHTQQEVHIGTGATSESIIMAIRCQIDPIMAQPLLNALPNYIHLHNHTDQDTPQWLKLGLSFLALEMQHIRPGRTKIIKHLIDILFTECIRDYISQTKDTHNWLNILGHPQLSSALAAIHSQPAHAWTVESLAELCCMSRSKFAGLFHQCVGQSPLAYLQQHRLNLASQLLRHSQCTIKQIAHDVGYSSNTSFSQSFKKQFNTSPTLYRTQHQNSLIKPPH